MEVTSYCNILITSELLAPSWTHKKSNVLDPRKLEKNMQENATSWMLEKNTQGLWILFEMNTQETQCLVCCSRSKHKEATKVLDAAQEGKNAHGTHLVQSRPCGPECNVVYIHPRTHLGKLCHCGPLTFVLILTDSPGHWSSALCFCPCV
jgi:hypothetical protein